MVNAPYIIADFQSWYHGVFEPVASPLIMFGSGFSTLTQLSVFPYPKTFYSAVGAVVAITLALLYITNFQRLKHTLWFYPAIMLWFS